MSSRAIASLRGNACVVRGDDRAPDHDGEFEVLLAKRRQKRIEVMQILP